MAGTKISELPVATTLTGAELVPVVQSGATKQSTVALAAVSSLSAYVPAGTGAVTTTVQDKLRETVSVFDFMTSAQVADVQSGTASIDVTAAFAAALAAHDNIYVPAGTYLTTGITLSSNETIVGDGKGATTLKRTTTGGPVITLNNATSTTKVSIGNLSVLHTGGSAANDHGIYWLANPQGLTWCNFFDVDVTASGDGVALLGTDVSGAIWNSFSNVRVTACGGRGWYLKGVSNQNQFTNCAGSSNASHGMELALGTVTGPQNITLINFSGEGNGTSAAAPVYGIKARGTHALNIYGGYFENNGPDANFGSGASSNSAHIWVQDCKAVDVRGCTFNKSNYDILSTNSNLIIEGNAFYEINAFTNRKYKIGFQSNSRIYTGINYTPAATVPMFNNIDSDVFALLGIQERVLNGNQWVQTLATRKLIPSNGADPSTISAAVGDYVSNTSNTSGQVLEWVQISSGVWRPTKQTVRLSTTANRPTLRAQDIGVMYMDTTLAANGKPIWWNGTVWVDYAGTSV